MPTYDGIGSSVTHEIEVVGDVFISNVEGGSLSTQVPFEIFRNVYGMLSPPTDSRQVRLRVQPTTEASPDDSYVTDMGIQNTTDNYFFITAPQNTSNVGDQNTFVISKTSNVGIGTNSPSYKLHLREDVDGTSQIRIENQDSGNSGRARFAMQHLSNVAYVDLTKNNVMNIVNNAETETSAKLRLVQNGDRPIEFCTDGASNVRMIIDGTGNVGIGTNSPTELLHLQADENPTILIEDTGTANQSRITFKTGYTDWSVGQHGAINVGSFKIANGPNLDDANTLFTIETSGDVGIGITTPGYKLHVVGDIYASGDITAFSDKRHKEDLLMIESALDKVKRLTGYTYTLHGNRSAGLLAQDVMEVLPEVVKGSEETNYSLAYGNLMGLIVEAIKELDKKIDRILEKQ